MKQFYLTALPSERKGSPVRSSGFKAAGLGIFFMTFARLSFADVEFRGVVVSSGEPRFGLVDQAGSQARWVELGQRFAGYDVVAFDSSSGTLTLQKDGLLTTLNFSAVRFSQPQPAPQTKSTDEKQILAEAAHAPSGSEANKALLHYRAVLDQSLASEKRLAEAEAAQRSAPQSRILLLKARSARWEYNAVNIQVDKAFTDVYTAVLSAKRRSSTAK